MLSLLRTDSTNPDFRQLVARLDAYLTVQNGDKDSFYAQFNTIDTIRQAVVAYADGVPVGCGAVKPYGKDTVEIKRMFVEPAQRGKGVAGLILQELEQWSRELGFVVCILETARSFTDAVQLYRKHAYTEIPNYGQYVGVEGSVCMQKTL